MKVLYEGILLRIFVGEGDKYKGKALYEYIVLKARELNISGATVFRGIMGFGANSRLHTNKILRLSEDMPIVIEIVDKEEKINDFLKILDECVKEGLITMEKVKVLKYR
jgi:PII-like signaling protein